MHPSSRLNPKLLVTLLAIILLSSAPMSAARPETLPGSGWWTGIQSQNVGNSTTRVIAYSYTYPDMYESVERNAAPGASVNFLPADLNIPVGFLGGTRITADQPLRSMLTITNRRSSPYGIDGGRATASSQLLSRGAASTVLYFPIVKNNWSNKTTTLHIQNAGVQVTQVTIQYFCPGDPGSPYSRTSPTLTAGNTWVVNPGDTIPPTRNCAAVATSTQSQVISGLQLEHWTNESPATLLQAVAALTPNDRSQTQYAPVFKNLWPVPGGNTTKSRTTGASIQNVGDVPITITGYFYGAGPAGTGCPPGYSHTVVKTANPGELAVFLFEDLPQNCLLSAMFHADGPIVGVVNESFLNPAPPPGTQSATAYILLPKHFASTVAIAPLFKEKWGNRTSGLQVQNVGAVATNIYVQFKNTVGTWTTCQYTIQPNSSAVFYKVSDPGTVCWNGGAMPAGQNVGVTVYSVGYNSQPPQPILGYVSEMTWYSWNEDCFGQQSDACYDRANYEAFGVFP